MDRAEDKNRAGDTRCCRAVDDRFCDGSLDSRGEAAFERCNGVVFVRPGDVGLDLSDPLASFNAPGSSSVDDEGHQTRARVATVLEALVSKETDLLR